MIIQLSPEADATYRQLKAFPDDCIKAIVAGMNKAAGLVVGQISRKRYTGQGPFPVEEHHLGVVTNRLRSSLRWTKATANGSTVTGDIGSNVVYAGVHEEGFQGTVRVASFQRQVSASQFAKAGTSIDISKIKGRAARREALGMETVRAHDREMDIPARAPLATGIEENLQTFASMIEASMMAAWNKKGAA